MCLIQILLLAAALPAATPRVATLRVATLRAAALPAAALRTPLCRSRFSRASSSPTRTASASPTPASGDNNVLSLRVGRFTASLRASLSTLRQLRAEGIDTITFQTILCSTTLSVDELLAMGGEDAEVVLTHHIRSSTLTVGGRAV